MNNLTLLEKKILLRRANDYINLLRGLKVFEILDNNKIETKWHLEIIEELISHDCTVKPNSILHIPNSKDSIVNWCVNNLSSLEMKNVYIKFEGLLLIHVCIENIRQFIHSIIETQGTVDLVLLLSKPNKIVVINDNEYQIQFFIISKLV